MVAWAVGPGSQLGQNVGDAQPAPYSLKGSLKPLSIDLCCKTAVSFMIRTGEYGCFSCADRMAVCIGVGDSCVDDHVASKSVEGDLRDDRIFSLKQTNYTTRSLELASDLHVYEQVVRAA